MDNADLAQAQQEAMAAAWEARRVRAAAAASSPFCASCGVGIPLPRLCVLPGAERCVSCQEAWEAGPR